jgi:hypothetical protein
MKNILIALFGLALIGGVLAGCASEAPAAEGGATTAATGTEGGAAAPAATEEAK